MPAIGRHQTLERDTTMWPSGVTPPWTPDFTFTTLDNFKAFIYDQHECITFQTFDHQKSNTVSGTYFSELKTHQFVSDGQRLEISRTDLEVYLQVSWVSLFIHYS